MKASLRSRAESFRHRVVALPEPRPRLEKDWAFTLVKASIPFISDDAAWDYVNKRKLRDTAPFAKVITDKTIAILAQNGQLAQDDIQALKEDASTGKLARKIIATSMHFEYRDGEHTLMPGEGYVPKDIPNRAITLAEARAMLPARQGYHVGLMKDKAWIVKYPFRLSAPRSRQVGFDSWEDNRASLISCLEWAWMVEKEIDEASVCPFRLE